MDDLSTYYQVLGIAESASEAEIKSAYRKLAQSYHPDKVEKAVTDIPWVKQEAEERFRQINEAWNVLGDKGRRRQYDEQLKAIRQEGLDDAAYDSKATSTSRQSSTQHASASPPPPPPPPPRSATTSPPPPAASSQNVVSSSPAAPPIRTGTLGYGGCLVIVVVSAVLFAVLGLWLRTQNRNAGGPKGATAGANDFSNRAPEVAETQALAQNVVRVRRINGIIYSYSAKSWGGNVLGGAGDSFPQMDLGFWSGLVSGLGDIHWRGSYHFEGNNLCLTISDLKVPTQTVLNNYYSNVGVGYGVELENGTFGDYTLSRALILYRTFLGDNPPPEITKCFAVVPVNTSTAQAYRMGGQWEGTAGDVKLAMRLSQKVNEFSGSMIAEQASGNGQPAKSKIDIEGYILDGRVTFVRRDKNALVYISYVAPFSQADPHVSGTWYMGLENGPWEMTRTGDIQGGLDDFASPDFSNPPSSEQAPSPSDPSGPSKPVTNLESPSELGAGLPADQLAPLSPSQESSQITISNPTEYNAYEMALSQPNPSIKARALENFLQTYPQSAVKKIVLRHLIDAYNQSNQPDLARQVASRLQQLNSQ